jgi:hypothetical protein
MIHLDCDKCGCVVNLVETDKTKVAKGYGNVRGTHTFSFTIENDYFYEVDLGDKGKRHWCLVCFNAYQKAIESF